jgi:hypothetical protein
VLLELIWEISILPVSLVKFKVHQSPLYKGSSIGVEYNKVLLSLKLKSI